MSIHERTTGTSLRITPRTIQIVLGALWLLDGALQLQPKMLGSPFVTAVIGPAAQGQPGFIAGPLSHMDHLVATSPAAFDTLFAAIQLLIGAGLLMRQTVKPALLLSFAWALGVWAFGEGFGMIFTGQASPLTGAPGAVLLYVLVGLVAWPRDRATTDVSGSESSADRSAAAMGLLGDKGARVVWATLSIAMGALWLLPANRRPSAFSAALAGATTGEPGWLENLQSAVAHAFTGTGTWVALVLAAVSCWVGLGPLLSRNRTPSLLVATALCLDFWVLGQSFGGILTGLGTDPNAAPLVIVLGLALFPSRAAARSGVRAERAHLVVPRSGQLDLPRL